MNSLLQLVNEYDTFLIQTKKQVELLDQIIKEDKRLSSVKIVLGDFTLVDMFAGLDMYLHWMTQLLDITIDTSNIEHDMKEYRLSWDFADEPYALVLLDEILYYYDSFLETNLELIGIVDKSMAVDSRIEADIASLQMSFGTVELFLPCLFELLESAISQDTKYSPPNLTVLNGGQSQK